MKGRAIIWPEKYKRKRVSNGIFLEADEVANGDIAYIVLVELIVVKKGKSLERSRNQS